MTDELEGAPCPNCHLNDWEDDTTGEWMQCNHCGHSKRQPIGSVSDDDFEKLRQNFTSNFFHNGPNMTAPDMSAMLVKIRHENIRLKKETDIADKRIAELEATLGEILSMKFVFGDMVKAQLILRAKKDIKANTTT